MNKMMTAEEADLYVDNLKRRIARYATEDHIMDVDRYTATLLAGHIKFILTFGASEELK